MQSTARPTSIWGPNVTQEPNERTLTFSPERPSRRYSMSMGYLLSLRRSRVNHGWFRRDDDSLRGSGELAPGDLTAVGPMAPSLSPPSAVLKVYLRAISGSGLRWSLSISA